jgi:hypothetical protein
MGRCTSSLVEDEVTNNDVGVEVEIFEMTILMDDKEN